VLVAQFILRRWCLERMQFEFDSAVMLQPHFRKYEQVFDLRKPIQTLVPLNAAPVVLAENSQDRVAQGQPRFGQIASNEIAVLGCELGFEEQLFGEEQSGAAVEQKSRRFAKWDRAARQM